MASSASIVSRVLGPLCGLSTTSVALGTARSRRSSKPAMDAPRVPPMTSSNDESLKSDPTLPWSITMAPDHREEREQDAARRHCRRTWLSLVTLETVSGRERRRDRCLGTMQGLAEALPPSPYGPVRPPWLDHWPR